MVDELCARCGSLNPVDATPVSIYDAAAACHEDHAEACQAVWDHAQNDARVELAAYQHKAYEDLRTAWQERDAVCKRLKAYEAVVEAAVEWERGSNSLTWANLRDAVRAMQGR